MTNNEKLRYSMLIQWSDEDSKYVVTLPEFPDCYSFAGDTYEEASKLGREAMETLIAKRLELGTSLPDPAGFAPGSIANKGLQHEPRMGGRLL